MCEVEFGRKKSRIEFVLSSRSLAHSILDLLHHRFSVRDRGQTRDGTANHAASPNLDNFIFGARPTPGQDNNAICI